MSHLNLKTALVTTLCLTSAHLALAFWAPMPLKQLVAANHLIVVGKVETIEKGKPTGGRVMDTAFITVSQVLKNTLTDSPVAVGDRLPLAMPGTEGPRMSTDIRYAVGQAGIWLLDKKEDKFLASFPGDFQKLDKQGEIEGYIKPVPTTTPTFEEWVAGGKLIPADRIFIGGSPRFDESTGKNRSDEAVYRIIFKK